MWDHSCDNNTQTDTSEWNGTWWSANLFKLGIFQISLHLQCSEELTFCHAATILIHNSINHRSSQSAVYWRQFSEESVLSRRVWNVLLPSVEHFVFVLHRLYVKKQISRFIYDDTTPDDKKILSLYIVNWWIQNDGKHFHNLRDLVQHKFRKTKSFYTMLTYC